MSADVLKLWSTPFFAQRGRRLLLIGMTSFDRRPQTSGGCNGTKKLAWWQAAHIIFRGVSFNRLYLDGVILVLRHRGESMHFAVSYKPHTDCAGVGGVRFRSRFRLFLRVAYTMNIQRYTADVLEVELLSYLKTVPCPYFKRTIPAHKWHGRRIFLRCYYCVLFLPYSFYSVNF